MASYLSIADIGISIVDLLRKNMVPEPIPKASMIDLCSPEDSNVRLGVFLYSIEENREFANNPISQNQMGFDLYYLLTAYSSTDESIRIVDEHIVLGKVLEVLANTPILTPALLKGSLKSENVNIRVRYESLTAEAMTQVWNFLNIPYKCSVAFKVGPVYIGSDSGASMSSLVR